MDLNQGETHKDLVSSVPEAEYGSNYKEHLLQQFQAYASSAMSVGERRQSANTFFLTINSAIMTAVGVVGYMDPDKTEINKGFIGCFVLAMLVVCYVWYRTIASYRHMSSAKFQIVNEIERRLPLKPFTREWALLTGDKKNTFRRFSSLEQFIPFLFSLLYVALFLIIIFS
jgi:hypothetical protein